MNQNQPPQPSPKPNSEEPDLDLNSDILRKLFAANLETRITVDRQVNYREAVAKKFLPLLRTEGPTDVESVLERASVLTNARITTIKLSKPLNLLHLIQGKSRELMDKVLLEIRDHDCCFIVFDNHGDSIPDFVISTSQFDDLPWNIDLDFKGHRVHVFPFKPFLEVLKRIV